MSINKPEQLEVYEGPFGRNGEPWKTGETRVPSIGGGIAYEN